MTQVNSDVAPFVTGARGTPKWTAVQRQQTSRPSGDCGAGGSQGQRQDLVRLAAVPETSSARQPPCATPCPSLWGVYTAGLWGLPSGLRHSKRSPTQLPSRDVPAS